jgi:uncharacterized membrane protein YqiK
MGVVIVAAIGIVVVFCVFLLVYASRYTKVGPNEVLVISGRRRRMISPGWYTSNCRLPYRERWWRIRLAGVRKGRNPLPGSSVVQEENNGWTVEV